METTDTCPICGHQLFAPYLTCEDYLVSHEKFDLQQCQTCNFRLTNPRPNAQKISGYYKSEQYVSHNDESKGVINSVYRLVRNFTLQSKLRLINKLNNGPGKILDIGCGTGSFLENCQFSGWEVLGVEPDADARAVATDRLPSQVYSDLNLLPETNQFDIITLWHVLEHIPNLNDTIRQLHHLVKDSGTVMIALPNSNSYDATYFKQFWAAYDVPRHLHHFTPTTIELLFSKYGFVLVDKKPMVFDAFYIAMLSTRYQGKTDYLKSIKVGLKSNEEAKRTGDFSSLTYLFKKG